MIAAGGGARLEVECMNLKVSRVLCHEILAVMVWLRSQRINRVFEWNEWWKEGTNSIINVDYWRIFFWLFWGEIKLDNRICLPRTIMKSAYWKEHFHFVVEWSSNGICGCGGRWWCGWLFKIQNTGTNPWQPEDAADKSTVNKFIKNMTRLPSKSPIYCSTTEMPFSFVARKHNPNKTSACGHITWVSFRSSNDNAMDEKTKKCLS